MHFFLNPGGPPGGTRVEPAAHCTTSSSNTRLCGGPRGSTTASAYLSADGAAYTLKYTYSL